MTAVERLPLRNTSDMLEAILRLREQASAKNLDTSRARKDLYVLIAECLELAQSIRSPEREEELRAAVRSAGRDAGVARWFQPGSDIYTLIGRFVFSSSDSMKRTNSSRYVVAIREAARRGIEAKDFVPYVQKNGGITAFIFQRSTEHQEAKTRMLRLNSLVAVPKGAPFTISLSRRIDGSFDVIGGPTI